jgi:hypothetical protein
MHRLIGFLAAAVLLLVSGAPAIAQDATPSPPVEASLLAGLGYPDLVVTFDGADTSVQEEVEAGRYHVVVENRSSDFVAELQVFQLPEGVTLEQVMTELGAAAEPETARDLFFQLNLNGGTSADPGGSGEVILDLTPGEWVIDLFLEGEDTPPIQPKVVTVTGAMPELTDPPADVSVAMIDLAFEMPERVPAGPGVWKVTNSGALPHLMSIQSYPEPLTEAQIETTLNALLGTPPATPEALLDRGQFSDVVNTMTQSGGQTNWIEVDLEPGQYAVLCFIVGPGDVTLHAAMGMYKIITAE